VETVLQFGRRVQHGAWGGGPGLVSGRQFQLRVLDDDVLEGLVADVKSVEDPEFRATFRRFNATTELFGFLLHYDNRTGMGDSGPYPLPDGRFAIVRDHILNETSFPWSDVAAGMPYAVVETMVFRPDGLDITINDIGTTFSQGANYLDNLDAVSVVARDTKDTPMSALRPVSAEEMRQISDSCQAAGLLMYRRLATKDRDEMIRDGVMVYSRGFMQPYAEQVGLWDQLVADGFDDLHADTMAAWPTLTGGRAAEILMPVFLLGKGFPPVHS
ncbi:MAG TPA: hypothetical protein VGP90_14110, partial [Acidimicrobiia bacterium]|nr:hypothetical protein [Acidimicrobiia bacterium]